MQYGSEKILPYNNKERKNVQVERMFDNIAGTYDILNRTLSLGFDTGWRKKGIRFLQPFKPMEILDIATGTGDMAISMCKMLNPNHIIGADLSEEMMKIGRQKVLKSGLTGKISFEHQDGTHLTYEKNCFDAVTVAFGIRNFENISLGLDEMYRVLKPGGHVMILELSTPEKLPMKQLYKIYSKTMMPFIGRTLSKSKEAYEYLPESIKVMPQGNEMVKLLKETGFKNSRFKTFTFGVCSMYTGQK